MKLKKITRWISILTITLQSPLLFAAENHPFPQNIDYFGVNPNNQTTAQQNNEVQDFYDYWKSKYLRQATTGGYYVHGADTDGLGKGTSESHGYGMLLTALMAGYDTNAKQEFDGLFNFFNTHRSSINSELMGWFINATESGTGAYSSATDGDLDIAYALLLADKQWGSAGIINYKKEAVDMINNGLRISDYHGTSKRLMLGDWDINTLTTRSSDWMPGHLRAFEHATGDQEWLSAIDQIYTMVEQLNSQNNNTGLMPDFVTGVVATPDLANANGTGELHSGDYFYNAARTPLRLAMDYIHNGNLSAKTASDKLTSWTKLQVGSQFNFNNYFSGYTVQGVMLPGANYSSSVFVAPVVIAASLDSANQAFVNAGWNYMKSNKESYFEDSVNLLSMLAITGNWWAPNQTDGSTGGAPVAIGKSVTVVRNTESTVVLDGLDDGTIVAYSIETTVSHGVVVLQGNQASYTPELDYVGADNFTYTVTDDEGLVSEPAIVEIAIVDDGNTGTAPVAVDKSATTAKNIETVIVLDGVDDGTIVAYSIETTASHGVVILQGNQASYTPDLDYVGADSFTYTVTDDEGLVSLPATVEISIIDETEPELSCEVSESSWSSGFVANITVTNNTNHTINGWQVNVLLGNGEQFSSGWSANFDVSTTPITASSLEWNKVLQPGASTSFGVQGSHNGNHTPVTCQ